MYTIEKHKSKKWNQYKKDGLPLIFIDKTIADFNIPGEGKIKSANAKEFMKFLEYFNNIEENLMHGKGLVFVGPVGVGKTFLMTKTAERAHEYCLELNGKIAPDNYNGTLKYNRVYFIQATTLAQMTFPSGLNEKQMAIRNGIKEVSCLFIDDISKLGETKAHHEITFLDDIIRSRYHDGLPTFFTSQAPLESTNNIKGLNELLSQPIYDLIRSKCEEIRLVGESQR